MGLLNTLINWVYQVIQVFIAYVFAPNPRQPRQKSHGPRIAIIGAGITGVSSAAHCVGHGFDVTLFEANGREHLGGIWSVSKRFFLVKLVSFSI
jgi:heterodisulfide reductase subunit A-like polyferredoxin